MKTKKIDIELLTKVTSLFRRLQWKIHDDYENYEEIFNTFCKMLCLLTPTEQKLILELTEDFLHCPFTKYSITFRQALEKINVDIIKNQQEIFFVPLLKKTDFGRSKSSSGLMYFYYDVICKMPSFQSKKINRIEVPDLLKTKYASRNKGLILFFDDFIGTGDTAKEALEYYEEYLQVKTDLPIIVALVAQEQGIKQIQELGYQTVVTHLRKKGISDSEKFSNPAKALAIIGKLEDKLGFEESSQCRFGYQKSEALVSMIRTPNNTFPIFWTGKQYKGEEWPAPFKR